MEMLERMKVAQRWAAAAFIPFVVSVSSVVLDRFCDD
jgi:hypothetical protein